MNELLKYCHRAHFVKIVVILKESNSLVANNCRPREAQKIACRIMTDEVRVEYGELDSSITSRLVCPSRRLLTLLTSSLSRPQNAARLTDWLSKELMFQTIGNGILHHTPYDGSDPTWLGAWCGTSVVSAERPYRKHGGTVVVCGALRQAIPRTCHTWFPLSFHTNVVPSI